MTEHRRWEGIDPLPDKHSLDIQMAHVQGYILALEDVFKDLAQIPLPIAGEGILREYRKAIRRTLSESHDSARRTLKLLKEAYERKADESANKAGPSQDV